MERVSDLTRRAFVSGAVAAGAGAGRAEAFVSALAQADPEQYSSTAAELAAQTRTDTGTAQTSGGRNGKRRKQV